MNLYFDNASTSYPKPPEVSKAVWDCMTDLKGNPGRTFAGYGSRLVIRTRNALAEMFNIDDILRIVFTMNATMAINMAIQGLLEKGDRVITSSMEHNAVGRPLRAMGRLRGVELDIIQCSPGGYLDPGDVKKALEKPAKLVVINHASNICGSYQDIHEIGRMVREHDAYFMVDASQSAGLIPIDVKKDCIDILAAPGHKSLYGPTGTGFCYISPEVNPEPLMFGGTGSLSERDCQPEKLPDRYESGTLNFHGLAGLNAGVTHILEKGWETIEARRDEIVSYTFAGLNSVEGLKLHGPNSTDKRLPVFSVTKPGSDPADLGNMLEEEFGIATRVGLHCAPWAHDTLGTGKTGTVRISPGIIHTREEIDFMVDAVRQAVRKL